MVDKHDDSLLLHEADYCRDLSKIEFIVLYWIIKRIRNKFKRMAD